MSYQFHHSFSQTFRFRANFHRLLAPGSQGGLGRVSRAFGEQWGLFQVRGSQAASLPWRPFLEGLWEVSLLATSGPVETARALLSVGRRCCVFRWPWLGCVCKKHKPRWFDPAALEPRGWCSHLAKGPGTPLSNPVPGRGEWKFRVPGSLLCNQLMLPQALAPPPPAGPLSKAH